MREYADEGDNAAIKDSPPRQTKREDPPVHGAEVGRPNKSASN